MQRNCSSAILVSLISLWPAGGFAEEPIDFERDVLPIFQQHCSDCHGAHESNGGLRLDARATLLAEADSGRAAVVPGDPIQSELIQRLRSTVEGERMPPDQPPLADAVVAVLERWIAEGAKWSEVMAAEGQQGSQEVGQEHWAFRPLSDPQPPAVNDATWPYNPIDHFLQSRRESLGLPAMALAEPRGLIRRASYALTGLPPTMKEVDRFLSAASSMGLKVAFAELVDELLSRNSYGERWGRHWMDWVRYADTAGDNSDFPVPQAYLYRNYIIQAFNDDMPYDRFLIEQIAGDLLDAETMEDQNRQLIATGYLAMARRFGSLVEGYPWHLTIEDTIDNLGRTTMGLTLACARCHDHKFDPISTREYYGLYGFFSSTRYPFPGIELFQTQNDFVPLVPRDVVAEVRGPFQAQTDELTAELEKLLEQCDQQAKDNAATAGKVTLAEQRRLQAELDQLMLRARSAGTKLAKHLKRIPEIPTAYAVQEGQPQDARIQIKGEPQRPGALVRRQFPAVLGGQQLPEDIAASASGRLQLAQWIASPDNPLTARVIVNRVWQRHYGNGLVATTSDFGLRGEQPTHPELLDWLASEFIRSGWSIKHLHRLIMNSRTYQLSSLDLEENLTKDPQNHFLWKFNRQRLDAESIRDSLLSIADSLDTQPLAEPFPIPPHKDWGYTQHHPFQDDYPNRKRSVYAMTKRLTAQPYYQNFDGPDPNACTSNRDQSVTALQALYFTNDRFLHEQAEGFAERLLVLSADDDQRIRYAFEMALSRLPTTDETAMLKTHLAAVGKRIAPDWELSRDPETNRQAWYSLARSLLRSNEFLYID
jgi:hypothetical protein